MRPLYKDQGFHARIMYLLLDLGWSNNQIAAFFGLHFTQTSLWRKHRRGNRSELKPSRCLALAQHLGISVESLILHGMGEKELMISEIPPISNAGGDHDCA